MDGNGGLTFTGDITPEVADKIYRKMHKTLNAAIGQGVTSRILNEFAFDMNNPMDSLNRMTDALCVAFGASTVQNMLYITVKTEFKESEAQDILGKIDLGNLG